jgi:hypothetical protein
MNKATNRWVVCAAKNSERQKHDAHAEEAYIMHLFLLNNLLLLLLTSRIGWPFWLISPWHCGSPLNPYSS